MLATVGFATVNLGHAGAATAVGGSVSLSEATLKQTFLSVLPSFSSRGEATSGALISRVGAYGPVEAVLETASPSSAMPRRPVRSVSSNGPGSFIARGSRTLSVPGLLNRLGSSCCER